MNLLSPEIGWAATRNHLFWTTDNGQNWKDITPKPATPREAISTVFFLDSSTGWVLFGDAGNDEDQPRFDIASTTDAGGGWTLSRVNVSGLNPPEAVPSTGGYMYFLDPTHGWINLTVASGSAFHPGAALSTQDGGKSWNWVPMGSGAAGPIMFTTLRDGWILSPDQAEMYVTHDASKSWQEVSLTAPAMAHVGDEVANAYYMPTFSDARHGMMIASFPNSAPILYRSTDGGVKWEPARVLPLTGPSAIFISGSTFFAAFVTPDSLTLTKLALNDAPSPPVTEKAKLDGISGLRGVGAALDPSHFFDGQHGWVLAGELLSTSDAGATWTDITPHGARPASRPTAAPPRGASRLLHPGNVEPGPTTRPDLEAPSLAAPQTVLGFDTGLVL